MVALLHKVTQRIRIGVGIARSETLVRHVKQREVPASLDGIADGPPLLGSGVDACGVVRASVEKEDGARGGILDITQESINVKANSFLVVVAVVLHIQSTGAEDGLVVRP